jgi:hypothetical protein
MVVDIAASYTSSKIENDHAFLHRYPKARRKSVLIRSHSPCVLYITPNLRWATAKKS